MSRISRLDPGTTRFSTNRLSQSSTLLDNEVFGSNDASSAPLQRDPIAIFGRDVVNYWSESMSSVHNAPNYTFTWRSGIGESDITITYDGTVGPGEEVVSGTTPAGYLAADLSASTFGKNLQADETDALLYQKTGQIIMAFIIYLPPVSGTTSILRTFYTSTQSVTSNIAVQFACSSGYTAWDLSVNSDFGEALISYPTISDGTNGVAPGWHTIIIKLLDPNLSSVIIDGITPGNQSSNGPSVPTNITGNFSGGGAIFCPMDIFTVFTGKIAFPMLVEKESGSFSQSQIDELQGFLTQRVTALATSFDPMGMMGFFGL